MESEQPQPEILRLRAVVEADPSAVIRVLQPFQVRNIIPHRILAQSLGAELIQIDIEIAGLSCEAVQRIVSKIQSTPTTLTAVVCE